MILLDIIAVVFIAVVFYSGYKLGRWVQKGLM
jgi:hypothetical protein